MNKITVELQNCYGIKKLIHEFDFSNTKANAYAIYAPNGSMKSSFAETFKNIADGTQPLDRIFPKRTTVCKILDDNGAPLPPESVLVLPPYDEFFLHTEKTSTLLVNNALRREYEQLHAEINASKSAFLRLMKAQSGGSNKDLTSEIALSFMKTDVGDAFYNALVRVEKELKEQKDAPFAEVPYDAIFDEKVLGALENKDCKAAIQEYIKRYNELLGISTYFKKGVFEYYNASQIAKALEDNGFFTAKHTITLNATEKLEITNRAQLETLISGELANITSDAGLKKTFDRIKKTLEKNITTRALHEYLTSHELLLPHLANLDLFREKLWKSYFKTHEAAYTDLLSNYNKVQARKKAIVEQASKERTQWEAAIDLFNERFFVPFTLQAKNKIGVLLGDEQMLDLSYIFKDNGDTMPVERDTLMQSLSQGEKKALYILNIIFEIQVRLKAGQETLFVVDDIADSFDYKNKYAIIQYLLDISEGAVFKQIILTHNFDFFRTVESRFVKYSGCLMATKSKSEIVLEKALGIRNVFVKGWKKEFFVDGKKRIACIPFMRNLIEYTHGETDPSFVTLSSMLHWKPDSSSLTQKELDEVYYTLFTKSADAYKNPDELVIDLIMKEAKACVTAKSGANFENKIVLAIAIRLTAERFMATKIADPVFLANITENQTPRLVKKFQELYSGEVAAIKCLNGVALMTPENIHLNAFMYEPILDMSDDRLRSLFTEVSQLK